MTETQAVTVITGYDPNDMQLGKILSESGFFADTKGAAQAVVKVLAGREAGFGPIASMTGIVVQQGKISWMANLMAAAIKRSGRYNYRVREHTEDVCAIEFFEGKDSVGISTFTMKDAKTAGLDGRATWKAFPRNMLFARAMSNGARFYCPDVFGGVSVYTPEELEGPEFQKSPGIGPITEEIAAAAAIEVMTEADEEGEPRIVKPVVESGPICADCKQRIGPASINGQERTPQYVADATKRKWHVPLCRDCAIKRQVEHDAKRAEVGTT